MNDFTDFDECSLEPSPCDENSDCSNSEGSYSCTCKTGFTGNGAICEGVRYLEKLSTSPLYFDIKCGDVISFLSFHVSLRASSTVLQRSRSKHYLYEYAQCV